MAERRPQSTAVGEPVLELDGVWADGDRAVPAR